MAQSRPVPIPRVSLEIFDPADRTAPGNLCNDAVRERPLLRLDRLSVREFEQLQRAVARESARRLRVAQQLWAEQQRRLDAAG